MKKRKNCVRDAFGVRLGSWIDVGNDFDTILKYFGIDCKQIQKRFCEGFGSFLENFGMINYDSGGLCCSLRLVA